MIKQARGALRVKLAAVLAAPPFLMDATKIQLEGREFSTPIGQRYVRETLKPITSQRKTLGPGRLVRHEGLYLVDVFHPSKQGTSGGDELADAIVLEFWPGLQLINGGVVVTILKSTSSGATQETDWRMVPVTISYRFDRFNPA